MLAYYGWTKNYDIIKEWYDGYRFGSLGIYCPWDVVSYCHTLKMNPSAKPENYWVNTSSNDIVRRFVDKANSVTRSEIEQLIDGGRIKKKIRQELTYRDLDSDIDNLWSLLFTTGYLTQCEEDETEEDNDMTGLVIPNREIRWIFVEQIRQCLKRKPRRTAGSWKISVGLFSHMDDWIILSNAESGEGYSDIIVEAIEDEVGIVIELKYAENAELDAGCRKALQQIQDRNYDEILIDDGMKIIPF